MSFVGMNDVRKSHRSTANRVNSILEDADYVALVQQAYQRPLVPNKRCGLWYVEPKLRAAEAYFKSTDGHTSQWSFSLKRLNLHLLPFIEKHDGIIMVDSTRRGKLMPDAFSKTVPVWCAVVNSVVFGHDYATFPPTVVSRSEQDQIRALIPEWAARFKADVPKHLWPNLSKPLRPIWATPNAPLPIEGFDANEPIFASEHAVVLCTASKQAQDGEVWSNGFSYVQGAADDHELWAPQGFTPDTFWSHSELRQPGLGDVELLHRMREAVASGAGAETHTTVVEVHPFISVSHAKEQVQASFVVDLRSGEKTGQGHWPLAPGKKGARQLAAALPQICTYYEEHVHEPVTVVSDPETDFAECVALMLDCRYFDSLAQPQAPASYVSKEVVVKRNLVIIAKSGLAPSRSTQNVIGSFLRHSK